MILKHEYLIQSPFSKHLKLKYMMLTTSLHKMVSEYMSSMIYLLPMLSGNGYVFADNNDDGICEYKTTFVRLFYNPR